MLIDCDVEPPPLVTGLNEGPPSVNTLFFGAMVEKSWLCSPPCVSLLSTVSLLFQVQRVFDRARKVGHVTRSTSRALFSVFVYHSAKYERLKLQLNW